MKDSALLIIDMQVDICYDLRRKDQVDKMLTPLMSAIDFFNGNQLPIYYICFSLQADDEQFERFGDTYCIEGSPGAEIIPELQPIKGEIIKKTKHSAFYDTELHEKLKSKNVKNIYLTGLQTQICVMTTAADASFRGYAPIAISDCVVSTRTENKESALAWIHKYVGDVKTLSEVINGIRN